MSEERIQLRGERSQWPDIGQILLVAFERGEPGEAHVPTAEIDLLRHAHGRGRSDCAGRCLREADAGSTAMSARSSRRAIPTNSACSHTGAAGLESYIDPCPLVFQYSKAQPL